MKLRRHQTLRAALEWSYGLLSPDEQTAFRRLGVFAGGFTLELAQEIVKDGHIDQWLVLDLLGHLIDKSLVIADGEADPEPRYRLLDTTRAFALEQLAVAGESEAMLRRHAETLCALMAASDANCWNLTPPERKRAVRELGNLRAAVDWAMGDASDRTLVYRLLSKCWLTWLHNGVSGEGVQRMLRLWPPAADLPARVEADFCLALARLNEGAGREEHWQAARRAETLYRELGDPDRLGDALLLAGTIGLCRDHVTEAQAALREAEHLVTETTALRKQAALASTQGECHMRLGAFERGIAAFRRQGELYRRAGAEFGEYLALGNVGSAHLQAGDLDAAVESLSKAVEGLRRINAPYGTDFRLSMLSIALALRGDAADVPSLAREAFDQLRGLGATAGPLLAAALHLARRNDLRRAVLLAGYAFRGLAQLKKEPIPVFVQAHRRIRDRALAEHGAATVEAWERAGEGLTEAQIVAIAFDDAPLEAPDGPSWPANVSSGARR
jgi:tetratricopeptide (TPR) repeat protein